MADSKEWATTPKDYLPGGLMSVFGSKCSPIMQQKKIKVGRLGNWIAVLIEYKGKRIEIINMYRIPKTSSNGVYYSLTQLNLVDRKVRSTGEYRKEIFDEIKKYINSNNDINDIIIAGDYN